jgi:hypothetical protein
MARKKSFGERMGVIQAPNLKREEVSGNLRMAIWNLCLPWLFPMGDYEHEEYMRLMRALYMEMSWPVHEIPYRQFAGREQVAKYILNARLAWTDFYQFAEFLPLLYSDTDCASADKQGAREMMRAALNSVLEQEGSPYRMAVNELVPVSDEEELKEIAQAATLPEQFQKASEHIAQALGHLAQRPEPNYHDCITQAWCAVESALWAATGDKAKIPEAIRRFQEEYGPIHQALLQQIDKLHGYASDEEGVRHAATEHSAVGEAEARLMLVSCSAMTTFLVRKALKF